MNRIFRFRKEKSKQRQIQNKQNKSKNKFKISFIGDEEVMKNVFVLVEI